MRKITMSNRLDFLEQPAPKIALSVSHFDLEGSGIIEGLFDVSNIGEGRLGGTIASASDILTFSPVNFKGSKTQISYQIDASNLSDLSQHRLTAVITSNGGEKQLVFDVRVNPPALTTKDGTNIATLEHFAQYARRQPIEARQVFTQKEFMILLFNTGYHSMNIYEAFAADPNKERGVDNFLVFNGLKPKSTLVFTPDESDITVSAGPLETAVTGGFRIRRSTWGYLETQITISPETKWLQLSKTKLTAADFDENNTAEIDYMIMTRHLPQHRGNTATITFGDDTASAVTIRCNMAQPFEARLDRDAYNFEDKGVLHLVNNTGRDLMVDIFCEGYVKFAAKRYYISSAADIDFDIKFSALKAASFAMRKHLYTPSEIHVVAAGDSFAGSVRPVKKLKLTLWNR